MSKYNWKELQMTDGQIDLKLADAETMTKLLTLKTHGWCDDLYFNTYEELERSGGDTNLALRPQDIDWTGFEEACHAANIKLWE